MTAQELIARVGQSEGYTPGTVGPGGSGDQKQFWVELVPLSGPGICSGCQRSVEKTHDTVERWVRDLPVFDLPTQLLVHRRRLACPHCGPKLEHLSWLEPCARQTKRFAKTIASMCDHMSLSRVAEFFQCSWSTVKNIHKRALQASLPPNDYSRLRILVMDEFAIQKGHRYASVIDDPEAHKVLWVGRGRTREAIRAFFEELGAEVCSQIEAVVMDMNTAFDLEVQKQCPNAEVVYDLFHVVAKYGREVLDRVRVDEANRLRHDKAARKVVKGSRWLLLRNHENIPTKDQEIRLEELLAANEALLTTYVLKDELKELWRAPTEPESCSRWEAWCSKALDSGIGPLMRFARRLRRYALGIVAQWRWRLHTSVLEGINNKIKVIKRMAYGYRDDAYFFLRIKAAFPGNT